MTWNHLLIIKACKEKIMQQMTRIAKDFKGDKEDFELESQQITN